MKKFLIALFLLLPSAALAQSGSLVVTTCGTLPQAYSAGGTRPPRQHVDDDGGQQLRVDLLQVNFALWGLIVLGALKLCG